MPVSHNINTRNPAGTREGWPYQLCLKGTVLLFITKRKQFPTGAYNHQWKAVQFWDCGTIEYWYPDTGYLNRFQVSHRTHNITLYFLFYFHCQDMFMWLWCSNGPFSVKSAVYLFIIDLFSKKTIENGYSKNLTVNTYRLRV